MANKLYRAQETVHVWRDTGGDDGITLAALTAGSVRQGDQWDRGAGSTSGWYEWRLVVDGTDSAATVGGRVEAYIGGSDGTFHDADLGTGDAASSLVVLPNLRHVGGATVQVATADAEFMASGEIYISSRYLTPVIHNNTTQTLETTTPDHIFALTPMPPETQ